MIDDSDGTFGSEIDATIKSMKRLLGGLLSVVIILAGMTTPVAAGVNDFRISSYHIEMQLGRDSEGRSILRTTETITAQFPDFDQNHGLERVIPRSYDGHSTGVRVESVTDEIGQPRVYDERNDDNGNRIVRMADMSTYVHGQQVYKLTYTQRDVTRYFADTGSDEFYWDTNGTGWRVPIDSLQVVLSVDESLEGKLTGKSFCYQGESGSTSQCDIVHSGAMFSAEAALLSPGENVTVAVGFQPETFVGYQMTLLDKIAIWWGILQVVVTTIGVAIMTWIGIRMHRILNRLQELGPVVPEYLPPRDVSITTAAALAVQTRGSVMTAQLLDLAVRHYIKIYELGKKKWYTAREYEIEIIRDPSGLLPEEQELLGDMFGKSPAVGERLNLKSLQRSMAYFRRTQDNDKKLLELVRGRYGLRAQDLSLRSWLRRASVPLLAVGLFTLSPFVLVMAGVTFGLSFTTWQLTDAGLALRRYLKGLKLYIGVGEQERLRMLQSPEGAEKVQSVVKEGTEPQQLIKLYERVLPYAVLFGQEKQWSKQLGRYYEQATIQPGWYSGSVAFNAAAFSAGMSGLTQAASYASSSSSSSGGSGGGGSSGGGGGGGGGGGV